MKVPMGPPPPRNANPRPESYGGDPPLAQDEQPSTEQERACGAETSPSDSEAVKNCEKPSPNSFSETAAPESGVNGLEKPASDSSSGSQSEKLAVPYSIPPWSEPPGHPFYLEVLKYGTIIEQLDVSQKGAYMFGRVDLCDFMLEHPTISRSMQFKKDEVLLYDLGSTHGTFINKVQVKKKVYTEMRVGDVIRFGLSSRLYIFQGPTELMPPEGDLEKLRNAKIRDDVFDREASLLRARVDASLANGISWGMQEDAIDEDTETGADEITWQTYKGQLTERQEKTRSKIMKRMEKIANMRKEIDAIRAKDIAQGGLTQGQQTQIARNEQRISQFMEELESLEETLNESIQESVGARSGKTTRGKNNNVEDEDGMLSDDDDFYDRTKKKSSARKSGEQQTVETVTADSLLQKKQEIIDQIEQKNILLLKEKEKDSTNSENNKDGGDDLDAYMSGLSSQLVHDSIQKIENELSDLRSELDKTMYLLTIADPMGEAARKRDDKAKLPNSKSPKSELDQKTVPSLAVGSNPEVSSTPKQGEARKEVREITEDQKINKTVYTATKPQWLGATRETVSEEKMVHEVRTDENDTDNFVDYKDRKTALVPAGEGSDIDQAASGLIIRKRKASRDAEATVDKIPKVGMPSSSQAEASAVDAVALLLKHERGYSGLDEEECEKIESKGRGKRKGNSQQKRVLGPARPAFLETKTDYESWVPPEGQTGDGRTSLNDRLGY